MSGVPWYAFAARRSSKGATVSSHQPRLVSIALAAATMLAACGQVSVGGVTSGTSRDAVATDVSAQALGKFNPADYQSIPFDTLWEAIDDPRSELRKSLTNRRIQVSCVGLFTFPKDGLGSLYVTLHTPRQPSGPQDRIRGFVAEGFAKSLFYMQSRERKIAWLSERGLKEDFVGPDGYFSGKVKVSPVTVFAQVLPAGEKALDPGFKHFSFHAVRREDGKLFAL